MQFPSICKWVNRLNAGGVEALIDKVKPGRDKRLNPEAFKEFLSACLFARFESYGEDLVVHEKENNA